MKRWDTRRTWTAGAFAAIAAVVGVASPAAAAPVQSTTTLQVSPSTAAARTPVRLTATVVCTGDPSGGLGMTFFDGGDILTTVPVAPNGQATWVAEFTTTGAHTITAAYNGNDNCFASNNTATVTVTPAEDCPWGHGLCRDDHGHLPGFPDCHFVPSILGIDQVDQVDQAQQPSHSPGRCWSW
ncbi:Ig-like domain-containing protein [Streptomyces sp. NPDC088354]|uniref:Ig-like domain-containing protein n=1 Tax=unclassified Streptomyces TaxID=2593676 RepID=UPI0029A72249|nr:Ig-like domain-containing protein [Streptomyces sp. MI02-7b]MDX3076988.1 Ig-like domain-containing protein [Streptomyces sp. MI02-7b]